MSLSDNSVGAPAWRGAVLEVRFLFNRGLVNLGRLLPSGFAGDPLEGPQSEAN